MQKMLNSSSSFVNIKKILQVSALAIVLKMFYCKVFTYFYNVEVTVPKEQVVFAGIVAALVTGTIIACLLVFPENVMLNSVVDQLHKMLVVMLITLLMGGVYAVLNCGQWAEAIVSSFWIFTVYKAYWTDSQLMRYCVLEIKNLKANGFPFLNQKEMSMDLQRIVSESEHNLDACKNLLREEVEKEKLRLVEETKILENYKSGKGDENNNNITEWFLWFMGIKKDGVTNGWTPSLWTWGISGVFIVACLGLTLASIGALSAKADILETQTSLLTTLEFARTEETHMAVDILERLNEEINVQSRRLTEVIAQVNELSNQLASQKAVTGNLNNAMVALNNTFVNSMWIITKSARAATTAYENGTANVSQVVKIALQYGALFHMFNEKKLQIEGRSAEGTISLTETPASSVDSLFPGVGNSLI